MGEGDAPRGKREHSVPSAKATLSVAVAVGRLSQRLVAYLSLLLGIAAFIIAVPILLHGGGGRFRLYQTPGSVLCPAEPAQRPLHLPWDQLLTREELRRGVTYYGSGSRLQAVASKLLAGRPIKVFALGGSVTGGGGASYPPANSYTSRFFQFINSTFPHSDHVLANKAIPASTAFLFATCLQHHVPEDADLVTLEFTVNERKNAPFTSEERRNFEQLIRRLLRLPGRPAVLLLHHYAWWESAGDGLGEGLFYAEPEGQLTTLAHYYDLPTLSVRAAAYHLMVAGTRHFKVDKVTMADRLHKYVLPDGRQEMLPLPVSAQGPIAKHAYFYVDTLHPYDPGHQTLAELLVQPLIRAVREVEAGEALTEEDVRRVPGLKKAGGLPPPMIPGNVDEAPGVCALLEEFKGVVKAKKGFQYLPERPNATEFVKQKWGWRGTEPGAWAELELDTSAGYQGSGGGDTLVWLSHLRSYQGMGTAIIECKRGCACSPTLLDGTWEQRVSLFYMTRFPVTRHQRCRLRVSVLDKPGAFPGKGHKVTLVGVMVTHVPIAGAGSLGNVNQLEFDVR